MDAEPDPAHILGLLNRHICRPDFVGCWRAFLRDCAQLLLPRLPPEAADWMAAADEFEAGRLDTNGLKAARETAWQFHDVRRDSRPEAELSGLRVVMWRLWPPHETEQWDESAWHFLEFCGEAGLRPEQWGPLLCLRFEEILRQDNPEL